MQYRRARRTKCGIGEYREARSGPLGASEENFYVSSLVGAGANELAERRRGLGLLLRFQDIEVLVHRLRRILEAPSMVFRSVGNEPRGEIEHIEDELTGVRRFDLEPRRAWAGKPVRAKTSSQRRAARLDKNRVANEYGFLLLFCAFPCARPRHLCGPSPTG